MDQWNRDKCLGALYGAAYGDSMGAATEFCTASQISKAFPNGLVSYAPSISRITSGIEPGAVTDDFGSSCFIMKNILENEGVFDRELAVKIILEWAEDDFYFGRFAGQNSKLAVERLRNLQKPEHNREFRKQNTNGGAMKMSPLAVLALGDMGKALAYAIDMCYPTHYNAAAVSGAAAICCAATKALCETATMNDIIVAGIWGAKEGRLMLEDSGFGCFGPNVDWRIEMAVSLGGGCSSRQERIEMLSEKVGTGIFVHESIPAVFGIIASTPDITEAILTAVNAGGDTDTVASMCGTVLGAYNGYSVIPEAVIAQLEKANPSLNLTAVITRYCDMVISRWIDQKKTVMRGKNT